MSVYTPMAPSKSSKTHDCGCGCGGRCGCESRCCELECLIRPNFFCGQLLTDADLRAAIDWTRRRFSLSRYRHGWGVACGLQVSCTPPGRSRCCEDTSSGPKVYLLPGYALDCCGNDLVVCEPLPVDLSGFCQPEDDPCKGTNPPAPAAPNPNTTPTVAGVAGAPAEPSCWDRLKEGVFAVDLMLRYHEDLSHGQRVLGMCDNDASCDYARIVERPCVHAELVSDIRSGHWCDDKRKKPTSGFEHEQKTALKTIESTLRSVPSLREYLRKYPPARFCFLDDLMCMFEEEHQAGRAKKHGQTLYDQLRLWLFYEWLLPLLDCNCGGCEPDFGVPIARILMRRSAESQPKCQVLLIDQSPRFRRGLSKDRCGCPFGGLSDLQRFYTRPFDPEAHDELTRAGIHVDRQAHSAGEILECISKGPYAAPGVGQELHAKLVCDPLGIERIAAFEVK